MLQWFSMTDPLAGLNDQQRQVVTSTEGPVLVLAGAGSGKTRALTHRLAYLVSQGLAKPRELLAVTFTNKAAKEMRGRVGNLVGESSAAAMSLGTFHALGARILREQHVHTARSQRFTIVDTRESEQLIKRALETLNFSPKQWSPRSIQHAISRAKNSLQSVADLAQQARSPMEEVTAQVLVSYQKLLAQHDSYDFDDLIIEVLILLQEHPEVQQSYQQRWRYLSVDEYQDTNPPQDAIIRLLLNENQNLCAVGDDYQAIYSWRGAKVDHILRFEINYPKCKTVYLTQNYRSTPSILSAANQVIAENQDQKHKELWTEQSSGTAVSLVSVFSETDEASFVRKAIEQHMTQGGSARDCAILYRTNAQSRALEEELMRHQIPYIIVGGLKFYQRAEVKDAVAMVNWLVNPNSRLALERVVRAVVRGVGNKTIDRLAITCNDRGISLREGLQTLSERAQTAFRPVIKAYEQVEAGQPSKVGDVIKKLLTTSGYWRTLQDLPDGEDRLNNLEELVRLADTYSDATTFLEDVALMSDIDEAAQKENSQNNGQVPDRVVCMTLHAAKGLEFERVFIVGCEEGLLPHKNSMNKPADIEEERRLLYVGMTRAKQQLSLLCASGRMMHGQYMPQAPSRFLAAFDDEVEKLDMTADDYRFIDNNQTQSLPDSPKGDAETVYETVEVGDIISHAHFGQGVVIQAHGSTVTCVFEGYGVRTIDSVALGS